MKTSIKFLLVLLYVVFVASCSKNSIINETLIETNKNEVNNAELRSVPPISLSPEKKAAFLKNWEFLPSGNGTSLLKAKTKNIYIVSVALNKGAKIGLIYDVSSGWGTKKALFKRKRLREFGNGQNYFALANALFFYNDQRTAVEHTYPFKQFNDIPTLGNSSFEGRKRAALLIYDNYADIQQIPDGEIDPKIFTKWNAAKVYIALDGTSDFKSPNTKTGRTMIGLFDHEKDGRGDVLFLLVAANESQTDMYKLLKNDLECSKVMAFDGGGSSQLIVQGKEYISGSRTLTSAFIIKSAN